MNRVRKAFVVHVDLDPVPGMMNSERSALIAVRGIIAQNTSHYNPNVDFAPEYMQPDRIPGERIRKAFLVYINLDPTPGTMHTQESVHNVLRNILHRRIPHYNPLVSLAPMDFQHTTDTEGSTAA